MERGEPADEMQCMRKKKKEMKKKLKEHGFLSTSEVHCRNYYKLWVIVKESLFITLID